ncbi:hypothetical protein Ssi03_73890 [Sphaerisporangium siamense]|nr:hypothetical protein Ssi03_73890 [Sphaerisporangium siamense]
MAGLGSRGQTGTSPGSPGRTGLACSAGDCAQPADGAGVTGGIDAGDWLDMVGAEVSGTAGMEVGLRTFGVAELTGLPDMAGVPGVPGMAGTPGVPGMAGAP